MLDTVSQSRILWRILFAACSFYCVIFVYGLIGMGVPSLNSAGDFLIFSYGILMIISPALLLAIKYKLKSAKPKGVAVSIFFVLCAIPLIYFVVVIIAL